MMTKLPTVNIKRHRTINSCLAAFFDCKIKELDSLPGDWVWKNSMGESFSTSNQEKIKEIRKADTWGWINGKSTIHLFFRKNADMSELIGTIAHEFGHVQRPHQKTLIEEQKASKYADVAITSYELAKLMMTSKCNHFIACPAK
jgi:hypothetical protein